ncbi:hypothetical protein CO251_03695 [Sulfobacillus sp. hq2]|nr:hypothetical protein CO251_03695 [Sulfobacillus sp. hq2]
MEVCPVTLNMTDSFCVVPVIHISSGRVIRWQGDHPVRYTGANANPLSMALQWAARGARHLHVVDLDASHGRMSVVPALLMAMSKRPIAISVGGGIYNVETAQQRMAYGATHLVAGSLLAQDHMTRRVARVVGSQRLWGSFLVANGALVAPDAAQRLDNARRHGITTIILTARHPENMAHPNNLRLIEAVRRQGFSVWTSGQIDDVQDIIPMYQAGAQGVLIGRALHEGLLSVDGIRSAMEQLGAHIIA